MSVIHAPKRPTIDARTLTFPIALGLALATIFLRLWYIQVVKAPELSDKAAFFRNTSIPREAPRGLIFDRNGVVLAGVQSHFVLTAVPAEVKKNPWVIAKVAGMLGVSPIKLRDKVKEGEWRPYLPTTINVGIPIEVATRIAEAAGDLPGIGVESDPMRYYPDSKSFSHILGYVWTPSEADEKRAAQDHYKLAGFVGKQGLEYVYEQRLMGVPGADHLEVDAKRKPTRIVGRDNPIPGDQLILSIDADLQKFALDQLGQRVGAAVAIDPRTGEVLCLASSPTYDAGLFEGGISQADWNKLQTDPDKPLFNRATKAAYAPGSTFKIITSLAAQEKGEFDPSWTYDCPGYFLVGKRKSRCEGVHGSISYHDALMKSCNTYFSALAMKVGPDAIRDEAVACGLDAKTGIDLPTETRGLIATDDWMKAHSRHWYSGDTVNLGIGQGYTAVSPLQMANLVALVANQGTQYKPHMVKAIRHPDGSLAPVEPEITHQVKATDFFWGELRQAMTDVVESGTAHKAKIDGIKWGGKTGSA